MLLQTVYGKTVADNPLEPLRPLLKKLDDEIDETQKDMANCESAVRSLQNHEENRLARFLRLDFKDRTPELAKKQKETKDKQRHIETSQSVLDYYLARKAELSQPFAYDPNHCWTWEQLQNEIRNKFGQLLARCAEFFTPGTWHNVLSSKGYEPAAFGKYILELEHLQAKRAALLPEFLNAAATWSTDQLRHELTVQQQLQRNVPTEQEEPPLAAYHKVNPWDLNDPFKSMQISGPFKRERVFFKNLIVDLEAIARSRHDVHFRLLASTDDPIDLDRTRTLLNSIAASSPPPITWQLIGTGSEVFQVVSTAPEFASRIQDLFETYFPGIVVEPYDGVAELLPVGADLTLAYSSLGLPVRSFTDFNPDPLAYFCSALQQLQSSERAALKLIFMPASAELARTVLERTQQIPDELRKKKSLGQKWTTDLSITVAAPAGRAQNLVNTLQQGLAQYTLTALDPDTRAVLTFNISPCTDQLREKCSLLTTDELAGFAHLPHKSVTCPELLRANMQSPKAPDELTQPGGLLLGTNEYRRQCTNVYLPHRMRNRHMYLLGASGSGKSTLLVNLIKQDLEDGRGLAVIDPHGDLIKQLLTLIPEHRTHDVILFDAADVDYPIALNPVHARTLAEQEQVRDEFMVLFERLFVSGDAPRMLHILRFAITTLVQSGNKTFFDIRRLLINAEFRRNALATIRDPFVLEFWEDEFPNFPKGAIDPITNKLSQFTLSSTIRNILGQSQSSLNFTDIMQQKQIFLASVPPDIGEENSHLLGSLLVSQIQLAAMRRSAIPPEQRVPFTLYVDEFQNFMSSSFEKILSEARKYNLGLVMAHQYTSQLDDGVRQAIFANTHTRVFFRVSPHDANAVRSMVGTHSPEQLTTLPIGQAIAAVTGATPFALKTFPPPESPAVNHAAAVVAYSRSRYAMSLQQPQAAPEAAPVSLPIPTPPPEPAIEPQPAKSKKQAAAGGNIFDELLEND